MHSPVTLLSWVERLIGAVFTVERGLLSRAHPLMFVPSAIGVAGTVIAAIVMGAGIKLLRTVRERMLSCHRTSMF
jgi:uncharacterized protein (DUF697 family)